MKTVEREQHQSRIIGAIGEFLAGRKHRPKGHRAEKQKAETNLWEQEVNLAYISEHWQTFDIDSGKGD